MARRRREVEVCDPTRRARRRLCRSRLRVRVSRLALQARPARSSWPATLELAPRRSGGDRGAASTSTRRTAARPSRWPTRTRAASSATRRATMPGAWSRRPASRVTASAPRRSARCTRTSSSSTAGRPRRRRARRSATTCEPPSRDRFGVELALRDRVRRRLGRGGAARMSAQRLRVGVFAGGRSAEHEVSIASAEAVLRAIDRDRFEPYLVYIDREGRWLLPDGPAPELGTSDRWPGCSARRRPAEEVAQLRAHRGPRCPRPSDDGAARGPRRGPLAGRRDRRRLPRRPRALRRGRDAPGLPRAGRHPVHRRRRAGQRGGHGQGRLQGPHARARPAGGRLHLVSAPRVAAGAGARRARGRRDDRRPHRRQAGAPGQQRRDDASSTTLDELPAALDEAFRYDSKAIVEALRRGRPRARVRGARQRRPDRLRARRGALEPRVLRLRGEVRRRGWPTVEPRADVDPDLAARLKELSLAAYRAVDGAGLARVDFLVTADEAYHQRDEHAARLHRHEHVSRSRRSWPACRSTELIARLIELALERDR